MRSEGEMVGRGGCEGRSPLGGEGEGEGVICEEGRGDSESLVHSSYSYLFSLSPLGSSVLEPHLNNQWRNGGNFMPNAFQNTGKWAKNMTIYRIVALCWFS